MTDIAQIMKDTELFLLDLDGTVYLEGKLIGDVENTLAKARKSGKKIVYLTNNSSTSKKCYVDKLIKAGVYKEGDDVYTSGMAAADYLNSEHKGKRVYAVCTKELEEELIESGIILDDENPDIVLLTYDKSLTYEKLVKLAGFLHKGLLYVATHSDINCPAKDFYLPDIGSFTALIEKSTGRKPDVDCGKPFSVMGREIERRYGKSGKQVAMFGDRLYTDIRFGVLNGFYSVLVMSGETTKEDYEKSDIRASIVLSDINEIAPHL